MIVVCDVKLIVIGGKESFYVFCIVIKYLVCFFIMKYEWNNNEVMKRDVYNIKLNFKLYDFVKVFLVCYCFVVG